MFESDDYDEVLSQIDFPEDLKSSITVVNSDSNEKTKSDKNTTKVDVIETPSISTILHRNDITYPNKQSENLTTNNINISSVAINNRVTRKENISSPKHSKRKIINSYFDHKSKRKFPGPAGLLTGTFEEKKDETICEMELLTQDIDYTQNHLLGNVFETPLWKRLLEDITYLGEINCIRAIKHQALSGNLQRQKAQIVAAFIESIDRSAIDPLITLRDNTGNIKCTLHRDAWTAFSTYIVSEYCALVLFRPTVLTTGSAYKKHYLNITLSNISSIYTSVVINIEDTLPDGFHKSCEDEYSIIKRDITDNLQENETLQDDIDLFEDLDNVFTDDMF